MEIELDKTRQVALFIKDKFSAASDQDHGSDAVSAFNIMESAQIDQQKITKAIRP